MKDRSFTWGVRTGRELDPYPDACSELRLAHVPNYSAAEGGSLELNLHVITRAKAMGIPRLCQLLFPPSPEQDCQLLFIPSPE